MQPIDENENINNIYLLITSKLVPKGTILCMKKYIYSRYNNKKNAVGIEYVQYTLRKSLTIEK